jgi:hypothetical protein
MSISAIMVQEQPNKQLRLKFSTSPSEAGVELTPSEAVDVAVELLRAANAVDGSVFDRLDMDVDYAELGLYVKKFLLAS